MKNLKNTILIVLILLNSVVLLGQIYPEGVPPFAKFVNLGFLVMSLIYFIFQLARKK